jgi:hypothetical protein
MEFDRLRAFTSAEIVYRREQRPVIRAFSSLTTTVFSQRSMRRLDASPAGRRQGASNSPSSAQHRELTTLLYQVASSRSRHTPVAEHRVMYPVFTCYVSNCP